MADRISSPPWSEFGIVNKTFKLEKESNAFNKSEISSLGIRFPNVTG
jgi:hypothetical protein